jgi:hypothetical protein
VVIEDNERPRADIQATHTGISFLPINAVRLYDLEVVEVTKQELIIVNKQNIKLDFSKGIKDIKTFCR